uniref:Transposon protein, putative, unclassified n=1 Tax=Oryza sativa subsp. japonica TaxID=39947 RepID=Q2QLK9_ORYSJ|nr:transposon protein, putative, unclassified [Oryza sativa Japonica Group]
MERGGRTEGCPTETRRGAVMRGRRHGSDLSGLGPGKRKKTSARSPLHASFARAGSPGALATNGGGASRAERQWCGGDGRRKQGSLEWGKGLGFIGATMSVWEGGTDIGRSSQRASAPASGQNGDREDDAGGGEKEERKEGKETCLLPLWEKKEGERGRRDSGRRSSASNPWKHARWWWGRVVTTAMTAGAVWKGAATGRQARAQARQALTAAATGLSATMARARAREATARRFGRRRQEAVAGAEREGEEKERASSLSCSAPERRTCLARAGKDGGGGRDGLRGNGPGRRDRPTDSREAK